jgi:hypothetical protein
MNKLRVFALATVATSIIAAAGYAAFLVAKAPETQPAAASHRPVWTQVRWPFPIDEWGRGLAFRCKAADCGSEINLYLRAKLGSCNCAAVVDDEMVDLFGDVDLIGDKSSALGPGRLVGAHAMEGRSRRYLVGGHGASAKPALSLILHDRCDMIVATASIGSGEPAAQEDAVLEFLNSDPVLRWAETTLGL